MTTTGPPVGEWLRLLHAAQSGDDAALTLLLERLYVRITTRMLRESSVRAQLAGATAEDIAVETIERVAAAVTRCHAQTDAEVLGWAYQIAGNVAKDHFRSSAARVFLLCVVDALDDQEASISTALTDEATPSDEDEAMLVRAVFAGYDSLPDSAAELIWHRLTGQPSWAETAALLGTTENGARRRFQRAIHRLRGAIGRFVDALPVAERAAARRALARRAGPARRRENS